MNAESSSFAAGRDLLRLAAARASRRAPLAALSRMPYAWALRAFLGICGRFEEIRSIYLRDGMLRDDWVPGLSDVDLTVVVSDSNDVAREHAFLVRFWRSFAACKRAFPMLGEIDVLSETALLPWSRLTIRGRESREWRRLAGPDLRITGYEDTPARSRLDALDHALLVYAGPLGRRLGLVAGDGLLARLEIERLSLKVRRYAATALGDAAPAAAERPPRIAVSAARALGAIDRAVRALGLASSDGPTLRREPGSDRPHELAGVVATIDGEGIRLTVLDEGLDERAAAAAIDAGLPFTARRGQFVTSPVLDYWLRVHEPFLHDHLRRTGHVVRGRDVRLPAAPGEAALARRILDQGANVLAYPRSRESVEAADMTGRSFASLVERALFVGLVVEHEVVRRDPVELATIAAKHYHDVFAEIDELRRRMAGEDRERVRVERLGLLRRLAQRTGASVARTPGRLATLADRVLAETRG